jgi:8-amino-7-oxononanoate synthase
VAGSRKLVNWLINRARSLVYSTSLPAAAASAANRALEILIAEPWRRDKLRDLSARLHMEMSGSNSSQIGPIVSYVLGQPERAVEVSSRLLDHGFLVPAIRPPTVPEGTSRLRFSLSTVHERDDLERLIAALRSK